MEKLIKAIRLAAEMTQKQFAEELNTTILTVNRWENGKVNPNPMSQNMIFEFCEKHGLDMFDTIVDSFRMPQTEDSIILYHGSRSGLVGDIAPISRAMCDFGKGFYMGNNPAQPLTLVCEEDSPIMYTLSLNMQGLKVFETGLDLRWALIIAYNRGHMESAQGKPIYAKYSTMLNGYDLIIGPIANDRMFYVMGQFFGTRLLTDVALIKSLSALDLGIQYTAVTDKACSQIKILNSKTLQPLELYFLRKRSSINRQEGVNLTNTIITQYRHVGRFFDEILEDPSV